jgi:hypothetical protein
VDTPTDNDMPFSVPAKLTFRGRGKPTMSPGEAYEMEQEVLATLHAVERERLAVALLEAVEAQHAAYIHGPMGVAHPVSETVLEAARAYREALKSPGSEPGP